MVSPLSLWVTGVTIVGRKTGLRVKGSFFRPSFQPKGRGNMSSTMPPNVSGDVEVQNESKAELFTRDDAPNGVTIRIHFPKLLPGKVFTFKLRLALSKEFQDAAEKLAGRPAAEVAAAQKTQTLDEICDLLQEPPEGFGDWPKDARAPGVILREYVTKTINPNARFILDQMISGVDTLYWGSVNPREFLASS